MCLTGLAGSGCRGLSDGGFGRREEPLEAQLMIVKRMNT